VTAKNPLAEKTSGQSVVCGGASCGSGHREQMQGKPGAASMASAAGHCSRKTPVWLTYAASGNAVVRLKTDKD